MVTSAESWFRVGSLTMFELFLAENCSLQNVGSCEAAALK